MSTQTHEKYRKPVREQTGVQLVSINPRLKVIVEHANDTYTPQGGLRTTERGVTVQFEGGRVTVPEELMPALMETRSFGTAFWVLGDPEAKASGPSGPRVVDGPVTAGIAPDTDGGPPVPDWDELGARQLRPMIEAGRVDLQYALLWEFRHKNRQAVIEALRRAKSVADPEELEEETPGGEAFPEGFVQPQ